LKNWAKELFERIRAWAGDLIKYLIALWIAARDSRTSWYARVSAAIVSAYAFSPIDLIPDFIPIIGYLDDIILVPIGITITIRLIPPVLWFEYVEKATELIDRPVSKIAATFVIVVWTVIGILVVKLGYEYLVINIMENTTV